MAGGGEIGPIGGVLSFFVGGYILLQRPLTSPDMNFLMAGVFVVIGVLALLGLAR
jgi:hypothetical protein